MKRVTYLSCAAVFVLVATIAGTSIAIGSNPDKPKIEKIAAADVADLRSLKALDQGLTLERDAETYSQVAMLIAESPAELLLDDMDIGSMRSIGGNGIAKQDAWIGTTKTGDGVCILSRQFGTTNEQAFSAACGTKEEFNANGVTVLKPGPGGKALLLSVQAPAVGKAQIVTKEGTKRIVDNASGATVALLAVDESVEVGGFSSSALYAFE